VLVADPRTPTLADLPRLRQARVLGVIGNDATAQRLVMLGFAPGTAVHFARRAPFRGPLIVDVRGAQICLRVREARRIQVIPGGGQV
jgi:ferrous iron transport protein A